MSDTADEVSEIPRADHPQAVSICAIDKKSVHRICSGQVVLTLATAVKELLENSIDANATIVEIKLKDYGSESVEVSDNGNGVESANFEGLTLKHHTSKLQDFGDLVNVETFGFRGEALSSLCALCDLTITTRHQHAAVGTKLQFDYNGKITKRTNQARQVGTTVTLQNLFNTLPVRHKEFKRNLKKEFVKMVQVLNSYCVISTGVRISCTNQTGKGSKSVVVSTSGNASLNENIANVFGPKQMQSLLEFVQKLPGEDVCSEFGLQTNQASMFSMDGYVSKCDHGQGRSSTDRQFFFINGRPFDSSKLSKIVNEVYHQYNRHQYPFVALRIKVEKESVDVNVTPDKRQVFLERERHLLAVVKASLIAMFEPTTSVLQMQMPMSKFNTGKATDSHDNDQEFTRISRHPSLEKSGGLSSLMKLKRSFSSAFSKEELTSESAAKTTKVELSGSQHKQRKLDSFVSTFNHSPEKLRENFSYKSPQKRSVSGENSDCCILPPAYSNQDKSDVTLTLTGHGNHGSDETDHDSSQKVIYSESRYDHTVDESGDAKCHTDDISDKQNVFDKFHARTTDKANEILYEKNGLKLDMHQFKHNSGEEESQGFKLIPYEQKQESVFGAEKHFESDVGENQNQVMHSLIDKREPEQCSEMHDGTDASETGYQAKVAHSDEAENNVEWEKEKDNHYVVQLDDDQEFDEMEETERQEKTVPFSLKQLQGKLGSKRGEECGKFSRAFRATISPGDNQAAEQELQKEIKKDMFGQMEILGQFNKGFIITRLDNDLFIVDQHATDEKFNFETLQRDTVIQSQKLICPQSLDLTASNEIILMDNLETFRKNGFEFVIDEEAQPTQRVKLASTPISKNWLFGKEDIEEMIFMLSDSPGVMCRPSRVRAMFASRSCRKSVMIGTTLNKAEMRKGPRGFFNEWLFNTDLTVFPCNTKSPTR